MFKIDAADYMLSLCGDDALRELISPGKSGSVFYLSHDDRFIIKTMKKAEVKVIYLLPCFSPMVGFCGFVEVFVWYAFIAGMRCVITVPLGLA